MTNSITPDPSPVTTGVHLSSTDGVTRRPVKIVEHPAFHGRVRRAPPTTLDRLGGIRVVSLNLAAGMAARGRTSTTSTIATFIGEAA